MVLLGCALDMMPLRVYATTYLELMAPSLDLGAPGAPKTTICPLNMQISLIVAPIYAIYGLISLCFEYDAPLCLCYHSPRAHGHIIRFTGL